VDGAGVPEGQFARLLECEESSEGSDCADCGADGQSRASRCYTLPTGILWAEEGVLDLQFKLCRHWHRHSICSHASQVWSGGPSLGRYHAGCLELAIQASAAWTY